MWKKKPPPPQQAAVRPPVAISNLLKPPPPPPPPEQQQQPVASSSATGFGKPALANPSQSATNYSGKAWNNSASSTSNSPWGLNSSGSVAQPVHSSSALNQKSVQGQGKKKKKKKKGSQGEGVAITDLFKRVKCDSNRNSGDWAQVRTFNLVWSDKTYIIVK